MAANKKTRAARAHKHGASADADESRRMSEIALDALADAKGVDARLLDVRKLTDITDFMIVVTGGSERHLKTLAERVLEKMRDAGYKPLGMEGESDTERDWVLVDFVDVVVHIMRAQTRERYDLESLWDESLSELLARDDSRPGLGQAADL